MTLLTADARRPSRHGEFFLRAGLIALPFLCPLVAGPSANAWQLLVAGVCATVLMLVTPSGSVDRRMTTWLVLCILAVMFSMRVSMDAWLVACAVLAAGGVLAIVKVGAGGRHAVTNALAWGLLAAGAINAVVGLMQYYNLADTLLPWITSPSSGKAWGLLRQRNQFATLISISFIAALWLHAASDSRRMRTGLAVVTVVLITATAASGSRTGLLQLALVAVVAGFAAWKERRFTSVPSSTRCLPPPSALLAMLPLYFALNWLLPQLAAIGTSHKAVASAGALVHRLQPTALGNESRLTLWHNVLSLIAERPFTGWGWGELSYAHFMAVYPGPRFPVLLDNAHNLPLHLAVELGIPAAVLVCGGFLWLVISARPWRERDPNRLMAWGLVGVILVHSLLEYPLWYGPFQLVFGLCLGMLWPARAGGEPASKKKTWLPDGRKLSALASIVLLSFVVYAAWDYTRISQIYLPRDERLPPWQDDTLAKVRDSWLFARQVDFAELTLTPVTHENAARMHALAERTLHFSPEPRVIVKLIESAELSGREGEARLIAERFRVAYPGAYAHWLRHNPGDRAPAP
jgi:O-antigen ligase